MNELLPLFLVGGLVLLSIFTLTWLVQLRTGNAAIVDTIWSAGFPVLAMVYFILVDGYVPRQLLVLLVVCFWGFRLAIHLYVRTVGQPEDVRYTALRKQWGDQQNIRMLRFYYFQALWALILSLPFALIMVNTTPGINLYEVTGAILWFVAFMGESAADYQLTKFKSNPENKGKICQQGLWYHSRHPNYFFEWLIWLSYFVMALGSAWGWVSVICPVAMYYFLTRLTGIAYTEASMLKSRGEAFLEYQRTTSAFFPGPKRRAVN